jgi:hypothetical protein
MFKVRILLFTAVLYSFTAAQTFEWVNTVPVEIQTNPFNLHSPSALDNSGRPVCARLVNFKELYTGTYYGDIEIVKISLSGSTVWGNTIYGKADVSEIITDGEDNVVCRGSFRDTLEIDTTRLIHTGSGSGEFILKLDSTGNLVWIKNGTEFITEFGTITALAEDGLNNIMLGITDYPLESRILTLDAEGSQISVIEQTNVPTISDIKQDDAGNIWVTGFTSSDSQSFNGLDTVGSFTYSEYVVKYNSIGTAQWVTFIMDITVQFWSIETDYSGNGYLSGNLFDSTSFGSLHANGPQWVYDYFVTKIDTGGNFIWLNEIPPGNTLGDASVGNDNFLFCREDGHTYVTGFFRGELDFGNGVILAPAEYYDVFAISYDQDGEVKWAKGAGSSLYDQGSGIVADQNGNCYLTGMVSENFVFDTISVAGGYHNIYIAKLKTEDVVSVESGFSESGSLAKNFILMQNYPNPFNPSTTIRFQVPEFSLVTIKVYDVSGSEILTLFNDVKPAGTYEINWNASNLSSGVYFYQMKAGNYLQTKKMILIR